MHITILTLGSRGDVVPYLALGRGLQRSGHDVRVITSEDFRSTVRATGFDFHPIRGEMQALLSQNAGLSLTESGISVIRTSLALMRMFRPLAQHFADDLSAPELRDTDLVVNQLPGGIYGLDLAESAGVPMMLAAVMPLTPTRHAPMLAFPMWPSWVPGYNQITHWVAYQIVWWMFRSTIRRWRGRVLALGTPPFWGVRHRLQSERVPVLNAFSPNLSPPPPDWGGHVHTTGAWFDDDPGWVPPDDLARFIDSDSPPIYFGFGSMPARDPERTTLALLQALDRTGLRAVIHTGWGGLDASELPSNVHPVGVVPHDWLFPRMAAVVHHGGSGTTHAGLRAGAPSLLVPFVFDQFYWGRRVEALGVGPPPIPNRELTVDRLAEGLDRMHQDGDMRRRAAELGSAMQMEDGVDQAVRLIDALLTRTKDSRTPAAG
jgi:sterol 3beta-glucosyltransferase